MTSGSATQTSIDTMNSVKSCALGLCCKYYFDYAFFQPSSVDCPENCPHTSSSSWQKTQMKVLLALCPLFGDHFPHHRERKHTLCPCSVFYAAQNEQRGQTVRPCQTRFTSLNKTTGSTALIQPCVPLWLSCGSF